MAAVRRSTPVNRRRKTTGSKIKLNLEKSKPKMNMLDLTWLFYGERKIGKTSLLSHFPDTYFFMFEPGASALSVMKNDIKSWVDFKALVDQLKEEKSIKTTVIDTGTFCYDSCYNHICEKLGIEHPTDLSYGKGWNAISKEFTDVHIELMQQNKGFIVTAHSQEKESEDRHGNKIEQIKPILTSQADKFYAGIIDTIAYYHYIGDKRWLQIRGSDFITAGTRCENNFLTPSGEQVYRIPMGNSSKEAYDNLVKAFNNKQTKTFANYEDCLQKPKTKNRVIRRTRTR